MSDTQQHGPPPSSAAGTGASAAGAVPPNPPKQNPVFRMMGMPNFKLKLPSRNWFIFWTVVGSWTGAVVYDRREKKKIQQKWCMLVSHLAQEPLDVNELPRRVTVVLAAPPGDGLMAARDHFHEYVKPVLVAGGLDWDVVEGRREGDVRAGLAEKIRRMRRRREGLEAAEEADEEERKAEAVERQREKVGTKMEEGPAGDIVIGRHTWKEYIRGLHEGWLGPLEEPKEAAVESTSGPEMSTATEHSPSDGADSNPAQDATSTTQTSAPVQLPSDNASEGHNPEEQQPPPPQSEEQKPAEPKKRKQPPPFISPNAYTSASLPSYTPSELGPAATIPFPHILGFLNTPIRIKRFLTRRYMADDVGRQVAAAVLASYRPFDQNQTDSQNSGIGDDSSPTGGVYSASGMGWEQEGLLRNEEREWHKSVRKERQEGVESVWLDKLVLDERIAGRMRRFVIEAGQEERARRIRQGEKAIERFSDDE